MDDAGLQNKPKDNKLTDDDQKQIDDALNKLPDMPTNTKPVSPATSTSPTPSPSPPLVTPTTTPSDTTTTAGLPPLPTVTPSPDEPSVVEEKPETTKPAGKFKQGLKKNGKKIVGGMLVLALLVGGVVVGRNVIQERQVVESEAMEYKVCAYLANWECSGCSTSSTPSQGWKCKWKDGKCGEIRKNTCKTEPDVDPDIPGTCIGYGLCTGKKPGPQPCGYYSGSDKPPWKFGCSMNSSGYCTIPESSLDYSCKDDGDPISIVCDENSGAKCAEKDSGDLCNANNPNARCIWLKNQGGSCSCSDTCSTNSGICSRQSIGSACGDSDGVCTEIGTDGRFWGECACKSQSTGTCGSGCGNEPSYSFNAPPKTVGPFPEDGTVVVYYASGFNPDDFEQPTSVGRKINLEHGGQSYTLDTTMVRERIVTDIKVSAGETINLVSIEEPDQGSPACAPVQGAPFYAWGWIDPNSDNTCGSGLVGPPSQCPLFAKVDITDHITWAEGYGKEVVSKQCWGDWREWVGDYDFNDFFLMFSYVTEAEPDLSCVDLTSDPTTIELDDTVTFTCEGSFSSVTAPVAYFRHSIDGGTPIVDPTAYAIDLVTNTASTDILVDEYGDWLVECRVCEDNTAASCTTWGQAN